MNYKKNKDKNLYKNLTISVFVGKLLSTPVSLFVAGYLTPKIYGLYTLFNTISSYFSHSHIGSLTNLSREVLFDLGNNDIKKAQYKINSVFTFFFSNAVIFISIFLLLYFFNFADFKLTSNLYFLLPFFVLSQIFNTMLYSSLKVYGQFDIYGKIELISKILLPLLMLSFTYLFGLEGLIISTIFSNSIVLLYFFKRLDHNFQFILDYNQISTLTKTGFPMYLNKVVDTILISIAVYFLTIYGNQYLLGIFGFAFTIFNINKLPFVLPYVITNQRKFTVNFNNRKIDDNKNFMISHTTKFLLLNIIILSAIVLVYSIVVKFIIPKYLESIDLMIYMSPGIIIYNLRYFSFMYFDCEGKFFYRTFLTVSSIFFLILTLFFLNTIFIDLKNLSILISALLCANGLIAHFILFKRLKISISRSLTLLSKISFFSVMLFFFLFYASMFTKQNNVYTILIVIPLLYFLYIILNLVTTRFLFKNINIYNLINQLKLKFLKNV